MKKTLTILFTALSVIIILDSLNAVHALFMFLLAGVIPGTNITLSAASMLEFFTLLIGFTLSRITVAWIRIAAAHRVSTPAHHRRTRISGARA